MMTAPEYHRIQFQGHEILVVLDHETARDICAESGVEPPVIPEGKNTVSMLFTTSNQKRALVTNQGGFTRDLQDDEREVNGLSVAILQEALDTAASDNLLWQFEAFMLDPNT